MTPFSKVTSTDSRVTFGTIEKLYGGWAQEVFSQADNFVVTFDPGFKRDWKLLLLGAALLIDFAYFEKL